MNTWLISVGLEPVPDHIKNRIGEQHFLEDYNSREGRAKKVYTEHRENIHRKVLNSVRKRARNKKLFEFSLSKIESRKLRVANAKETINLRLKEQKL